MFVDFETTLVLRVAQGGHVAIVVQVKPREAASLDSLLGVCVCVAVISLSLCLQGGCFMLRALVSELSV